MKPDLRAHIDDAKARVKVSGVVERDVPLDGHKAIRCPFGEHEDSHPSFSVSDAKGRWKCWGCGRGGDVVDWLMQRRGLSFRDAVDEIGKLAGLPPYAWKGLGPQDVEDAHGSHQEEQYRLLTLDLVRTIDAKQEAAKYYATSLFANRHEPLSYARDGRTVDTTVLGYQTETRGHSEESLRNALVGWADGKLLDHLHRVFDEQHGAKLVTLAALASGLVKRGKGGALRDFFRRGMYTYPVVDAAGTVVTITGKHPDDEIPNYQLPKCVTLTVKNAAKKVAVEFPVWGAGWYFLNQVVLNSDDLLIVEGEDDVGSVRDRGDHEAVVGTRGLPGAEQLAELAKHRRGKRSFLAFDNDEAGVEYTWLVAEALAGPDCDVRAVALPARHKDIDDALCAVGRESGAALVRKLIAEAKPVLDRLADHLRQDRPAAERNDAATRFARIVLKQPPLVQDEWHKRLRETLGASAGAIRKVFRAAERSARKDRKAREEGPAPKNGDRFRAVRLRVDAVRRMEGGEDGLKRFEVNRRAAETVIADLASRGRFHHDRQRGCYFDGEEKRLMAVERDNLDLELLLHRYGITPSEDIFRYVLDALRLEAFERGTGIRVHHFSHYDHKRNTLYLYDLDRRVFRITPDTIEAVDNGTDSKAFLHNPAWEPFRIGEPNHERSPFDELIVRPIPFRKGTLSLGEQRALFVLWFYTLFFPELFPTRAILAFVGEAGSVKSFALKKVGRLLFGRSFNVMQLSKDPKDFEAAVTNAPFVAVDNSDTRVDWLPDHLAVAATGGSLQRRELYTTNRLVEFPIVASVAITSRTPQFRREDIADRLLLFYLKRLHSFTPESDLLQELENRRDEVMTEIVGHLQEIVRAFRDQAGKVYPSRFRMADFASFALRIAHAQGWGDRLQSVLTRLASDQLAFALEGEPLADLIAQWLTEPKNAGRWVTAAELSQALGDLAEDKGITVRGLRNPRSLAQKLRGLASSFQELFDMDERVDRSRRRYVSFRPKPERARAKVEDVPW